MNNKTDLKRLLSENKKALKFLHHAKGFDFEKPFFVARIPGRFTFNMVKKAIENNISGKYSAAILYKSPRWRELYYADMTSASFKPLRAEGVEYWEHDIDYAVGVGYFEDYRKSAEHCYIIAQAVEHVLPIKRPAAPDLSKRFNYSPEKCSIYSDGKGGHYLARVMLQHRDRAGEAFEHKTTGGWGTVIGPRRLASVGDAIDKSGYIVYLRREDLKRRADALRKKKAAAAAAAFDSAAVLAELKELAAAAKSRLAAAVLAVNGCQTASSVEHAAEALRRVYFKLGCFEEYTEKNKFRSVGEIEADAESIRAKCAEIFPESKEA